MANPYTKNRIHKITRRFGLLPLRSGTVASFYRENAIIQVQTETGTFAMKPFFRNTLLRTSTVHQMKTTAAYIELMMNSGFSYMPKWLTTPSGKLWTLHLGRPFYMTEWIKGRNLETNEDFEELGRGLATLHTTSSGLLDTKGPFTHKQIELWKIQDRFFRRRMATAIQTHERNRKWYKKYGKYCKRLTDQAWANLSSPEIEDLMKKESEHPALIHNDITSPNVIISENGQLFIIDWDRVKVGSIYVDLAKALMNTTQFNPDFILALLKGYEERRPLDETERKLISSLYGLPREAWHATRFPHQSRSREMLEILEKTWHPRLKAMDLLDEWTKSIPKENEHEDVHEVTD
ncbi:MULTISPECIES: phosphotransferase [unclassified Paenibacillus]|uniref:phosphotransferase n=1 Tax=unclassified Paenibacillus TaxID=185978 RepID=UPI002789DB27|nr:MULTISPECIES: phosphotransferase [unclassified Paenibacillus]MDQ0903123.1 Ser/Thr protein kinase RdoA (MazF antagonist) [Paenibacillus sp. V4I7]MDQ0918402.1 Ser/Thr protein kinase RdoA (MazF antagonist) [Paenibacillus sp. V4I5]